MWEKMIRSALCGAAASALAVSCWAADTETSTCADAVVRQRTVLLNTAAGHIVISDPAAPTRQVTLRPGLMPVVHHLPDGRHALLTTQDGWVIRVDLAQARQVADVRVGQAVRSVALSGTRTALPSVLAVVNAIPNTLVLLDENLQTLKVLKVTDKTGKQASSIAMVRTANARDSFVVSLLDVPELWEVSYKPTAPEIALGMVHDFQYREGSFVPGYLNAQRISLPTPVETFHLSNEGHEVLSPHLTPPSGAVPGAAYMQVTHLDVRGKVSEFSLPHWPASPELMKRIYGETDCASQAK
jgi:hypothetical protein